MRKIIKILVVLILFVVAAVAGIIFTTDINQYKKQIIQVVKNNTGRDFNISGNLRLAPSLIPTIAFEGVSLGNASWAKDKNMLSVSKFEAQVALIPLLKKNIQIVRLILIEPNIKLETNKEGEGNWVLAGRSDKKEKSNKEISSENLPALAVNEVHIKKANVSYKDGKTGKTTELVVDEITANSSSFSDPMDLLVKASLNQSSLNIKGSLGSINNLLENEDYPVNLKINIADAEISVEGKLGQPMSAKGINLQISVNINKLSDLNKMAGSELPDVGPLIFNGKLSDTKLGYSVKAMTIKLMEYNVKGDVEISLDGSRPKLTANLNSDSLDISPFQRTKKEKVKKEKLFSSDPLPPLDKLKAADANISFKSKELITKDLTINDVVISITLSNGKLKLLKSGNTAGGSLSAKIDLGGSNNEKSAVLNSNIQIKQIELGQIPSIQEKEFIIGGKTDITIKAKGSGSSVSQIMAGLNGKLLIKVGKGQISSTALEVAGADALMNTLSMLTPSIKESDGNLLECAVVNFDIKNGIATADKGIAMSTNYLNVIGEGNINLKTEQLDIGITPKAKEGMGLNLGQLAGLVRLGGTLANPSPKADTKVALKSGLAAGAAVATGGLSLLAEGLLDSGNSSNDINPCDIALGIAPKTKPVSPKPEKEKSTVEKTTESIGDKLKNLF